ncbi:LysR family transcriptional regulator [Hoeflea prorocentri]|uniref:LysR family transcriptional regulator n=1 Tax=Hoeflea prorocentri TaxID=1922333 RepID=A0A9X3UG70_9HYPH|nr:LysR family transcriptional regulator [Hoeflea prorocentri]MCY6380152.1 LysR family transcriptional regulator [Hoeflea prorocentri]MDA5397952.1 LysR family transcriptional regulator [Hoeflea prorocentri]
MHTVFLRYLDEVARQGSIRKAANILNVSSTSVNRKIINIEEALGVRLFDRSPEGVEITPAGKIVLEHCRKTLYDFDRVKAVIDDIRDLRTGHLNIQTLDSVTFGILPPVLEEFGNKYPGISLSITTEQPEAIVQSVISGETDIGISFSNDIHPDARVFAERAAPFGLIMRPDHPLAERSSVTVDEVSAYPLVRTIDARAGHSLLDQEMTSLSVHLSTHIFTNALVTAKQAILSNQVVGIYTKIGFLQEIERGELNFAKLSHKALGEYKIGLVVSAAASINPIKHLFLSVAERHLKTLKFDA